MAAKRHMDIKRNITGHNMIIADMTGYSLKQWCLRRPGRLAPKLSRITDEKSVTFTMEVYSHIIDGMQDEAKALPDEVLSAGRNGARIESTPEINITVLRTHDLATSPCSSGG